MAAQEPASHYPPDFPRRPIGGCGQVESTVELFKAVCETLTDRDLPEKVALLTTYFCFSAWFPDCLPVAPCLLITAPRPEARFLLEFLACLVCHPLLLGRVTPEGLLSLPMDPRPTLLIDHERVSSSTWNLLRASNYPDTYVPSRGGLRNIYCAKAIYRGSEAADDNLDDSALRINLPPSRGRFPVLDAKDKRAIAEELQPKMLAYRHRNFAAVRDSHFDLPEFSSGIRILARVLGAPIIGAPELQADLAPLLREYYDETQVAQWLNPRCVLIEAALYYCHGGNGKTVYVGQVTRAANAILKGRGETIQLEAKQVGGILRRLGLIPNRNKRGFAIQLNDTACRHIHQLANSFDVTGEAALTCPHCAGRVAGEKGTQGAATIAPGD
jgi:hypothetical protein